MLPVTKPIPISCLAENWLVCLSESLHIFISGRITMLWLDVLVLGMNDIAIDDLIPIPSRAFLNTNKNENSISQ